MMKFDPKNLASDKDISVTDPVCGMRLTLDEVAAEEIHEDWAYFFCSEKCHQLFVSEPERYLSGKSNASRTRSDTNS